MGRAVLLLLLAIGVEVAVGGSKLKKRVSQLEAQNKAQDEQLAQISDLNKAQDEQLAQISDLNKAQDQQLAQISDLNTAQDQQLAQISDLLDVRDCDSNPCQNGGTCVDQVHGYVCICKCGDKGVHCENARVPQNVALNGEAMQVSQYLTQVAALAVDGDKSTPSCTLGAKNAWWAVDLGQLAKVDGVNVSTDPNVGAAFRMDDFVVGLTNEPPNTVAPEFKTNYDVCHQYSGQPPVGTTVYMPCADLPPARYVIIQTSKSSAAMCLMEVEVYASNQC